jgi:hypothetical protein
MKARLVETSVTIWSREIISGFHWTTQSVDKGICMRLATKAFEQMA